MSTQAADRQTRRYRQVARAQASDRRRWRIQQAAWELFARQRYDDVTVAEIAERAGLSERTVYRLVGPKERLLTSWEEEATADREAWEAGEPVDRPWALRIGWQRWLDDDHRPIDAEDLEGFVGGTVRFHEQWGDALMNLHRQVDEVEQFATFMGYARRRHRANVDHFAAHLADGLPADARRRRLEILYTLLDFQTWHSLRRDAGLSRDQTEQALLELLRDLDRGRR